MQGGTDNHPVSGGSGVSTKNPKNIAASVRQRILNKARTEKRPFQELLQYYAMEKFLGRLANSRYADRFVLKGALMLHAWQAPIVRSTMDIDVLAYMNNSMDEVAKAIKEICTADVEPDGLEFRDDTVQCDRITEDAHYQGVRATFLATLENARVNMQIDIGFGDAVYPEPIHAELPDILGGPSVHLAGYTKESSIAEKTMAMISRGALNSRMKDFYDIWLLCTNFDFDGKRMQEALRRTLDTKDMNIPDEMTAFTASFAKEKSVQWRAFIRRLNLSDVPQRFDNAAKVAQEFLSPVLESIRKGRSFSDIWPAGGPWCKR